MRRLLTYLNPIAQLGKRHYSLIFPLALTTLAALLIEFWAFSIVHDPDAVGTLAIILFLLLIIYFSFHDGLRGGFTTVLTTILYYFYIVYSRSYTGEQFSSSIELIIALGVAYFSLAGIIGWLRQKIDTLIEQEANARKRFQTIMQQLPVGVIITDAKGKIEFANKNADSILGTKVPIGFTVGDKFFVDVVDSKPSPPSQSLLAKALSTGKPSMKEEFIIRTHNNKKIYIEASVSPIRNRKGSIIAAAEILSNVTSQRETEKRKDDFINMASHELKTPLTSMKLYLTALKKRLGEIQDEKTLKTLGSIIYQTERLQNLVSDLLDVSRLQTGKLTFSKELLRLDTLISDAVRDLQPSIHNRIIFHPPSAKIRIHADKFRTYQVLTNLITNAVKYSPEEKEIIIRAKRHDGKAVVSVQDFGIGIEKEQHNKIFDRLYQASDPQSKKYPGLGMGLYISREIIKRHKGKIWVESTINQGSTFFFTLPLN